MAIQKMELLSIAGPLQDFDRIISQYVLGFDIHIENAMSVLENVRGLNTFAENSAYNDLLSRVREFLEVGGIALPQPRPPERENSMDTVRGLIEQVGLKLRSNSDALDDIRCELAEIDQVLKQLEHMQAVEINLDDLFHFEFIKFRFGRLPRAGYKKLQSYLQDIDAFFIEGEVEKEYIYGVYFVPAAEEEKIDAIFTSLYFERIIVSGESHGTPKDAYESFKKRRVQLLKEQKEYEAKDKEIVAQFKEPLLQSYLQLEVHVRAETVKKYSAHTRESFYMVGWVAKNDVKSIQKSLDSELSVIVVEEEPGLVEANLTPPIKMRNPRIFRPFESFVEMYGLPSYNEFDPTPLFALSYIIMFGIMFGDVGHGLVLAVAGLLFYLWKKQDIGAIVSMAGVSSMVFGLMYSDMFGSDAFLLEHLPQLHVISPMEEINMILILTVGLGVVIILISMLMNLINCVKRRDWGRFLFDQNGIAGMVFYISVVLLVAPVVGGMFQIQVPQAPIPSGVLLALMVIGLAVIYLKEPLSNLVSGKGFLPPDKGDYFVSAAFELFEIVLSFATNTISFVRLGAFALAHAGMMSVVFIFADMAGGAGSIAVLLVGNILVMGLEGLVVGIQSLRLEFYEMFSRFYIGDGRPFVKLGNMR